MVRPVRTLLLCFALVGLAGPGPLGCSGNPRLSRIRTPDGGVSLSPDLAVGQTYEGHLIIGNTRQIEGLGTFNQNIECDFEIASTQLHEPSGGAVLRAKFRNVVLDWTLPPSAELSGEEFTKLGGATLESLQLQFIVDPTGKVLSLPLAPANTTKEIRRAIEHVIAAMESAYFGLPAKKLRKGERWTATVDNVRPDEAKTEGEFAATFDGLFHHKVRDEDVAKLTFERDVVRSVDTDVGRRDLRWETQGVAYFAVDGYLAALDGQQRFFDPDEGITVSKLGMVWQRKEAEVETKAPVEVAPTDPCAPGYRGDETCTERVQDITDPCDPDYVGPQKCSSRGDEPVAPEPEPTEDPEPSGSDSSESEPDLDNQRSTASPSESTSSTTAPTSSNSESQPKATKPPS